MIRVESVWKARCIMSAINRMWAPRALTPPSGTALGGLAEALDTVETARQDQSLRAFTEDGGVDGQALGLAGLGWDDFPRVESAACICGHAAEGCACSVVGWMKHGDDITGGDDVSAGP